MRSVVFTCIILLFISCSQRKPQAQPGQPVVPPALQEGNKSSADFLSKRHPQSDLIEELYQGLVKEQKTLKEIEDKINDVNGSADDSTGLFTASNSKNTSYYSEAEQYVKNIKDSVLKFKIKELLRNSLDNYNSLSSKNNALLKSIDTKKSTLEDLHLTLKLVKTLPVLEKYQAENIPSTKPMEGLVKKYDEVIYGVDSLIKK